MTCFRHIFGSGYTARIKHLNPGGYYMYHVVVQWLRRFSAGLTPRKPVLNMWPVYMGLEVDKLVLAQFSSVIIISLVLHPHSVICHRLCITLAFDSVVK